MDNNSKFDWKNKTFKQGQHCSQLESNLNMYNWSIIMCIFFCFHPFWSYRLSPQYQFPLPLEDIISAVKFFLQDEILATYWVDPNRIGISGESSGGLMAAAVTTLVCFLCWENTVFVYYRDSAPWPSAISLSSLVNCCLGAVIKEGLPLFPSRAWHI